jgi:ABC-type transporter lipoprotein component MlaA
MKTYEVQLHRGFTPMGPHWIRSWVDTRTHLDTVEKRKIKCPYRELKPNSSVVYTVVRKLYKKQSE